MKSVSSFEFRDNLSSYLDLVEKKGKKYTLTRYNKPVARVVPYYNEGESALMLADKYFGFFKTEENKNESGSEFVDKIRRSDEALKESERMRNWDTNNLE